MMRRSSVCVFALCFGALAGFPAAPSAAFGLSIGPFHLGLPFGFHHRFAHRHRITAERGAAERTTAERDNGGEFYDKASAGNTAPAQSAEPASFYPADSLPGIFDEIFRPGQAPDWPYGYDGLFRAAFTKEPADARACHEPARTEEIVGRITAEIRPTAAQMPLVQELGRAIGMTAGYVARTCPANIPAQPAARLELMQSQLQALTMALDLVRPPLQKLEQSLDPAQTARFAATPPRDTASSCGAAPAAIDWSIDDIDHSVQPDPDQRQALGDLKQAFASTALDLHAHCPQPLPPDPLARLEAIEGRLDASWRAALSMQVALAKFESTLNEAQRGRFETTPVAQTQ